MTEAYPGFNIMKHLGVLLLPPGQDAVHHRVTPQQYVTCTHLYSWAQLFEHRLALTRVSFYQKLSHE